MKSWMKKAGLIAASAAALTTLVSVGPAKADTTKVIYFSIPNNTYCSATYGSSTEFTISNMSGSDGDITLYLYDTNGNSITDYSPDDATLLPGKIANIVPGTTTTIHAGETKAYNIMNGMGYRPCTTRSYRGKIVVNSDSGQFIASGTVNNNVYSSSSGFHDFVGSGTVNINNGQPF